MNDDEIFDAFYALGEIQGAFDGLRVQNIVPEGADYLYTHFESLLRFMKKGAKAIRTLNAMRDLDADVGLDEYDHDNLMAGEIEDRGEKE